MKRILILSVTAASLGLLALAYVATGFPIPFSFQSSAMTAEDVKIPHLDDSNFYQTVKDSKTIVVVDFYADWCGPCRRVAPSIQKLANEYNGKVLVVKVNVDYAPKVSQDQGIRSIPTVAIDPALNSERHHVDASRFFVNQLKNERGNYHDEVHA